MSYIQMVSEYVGETTSQEDMCGLRRTESIIDEEHIIEVNVALVQ